MCSMTISGWVFMISVGFNAAARLVIICLLQVSLIFKQSSRVINNQTKIKPQLPSFLSFFFFINEKGIKIKENNVNFGCQLLEYICTTRGFLVERKIVLIFYATHAYIVW